MKRLLLLSLIVSCITGCSDKKPHGLYVAKIGAGLAYVEMRYDFREDGVAAFLVMGGTGGNISAASAQGRWFMKDKKVIFEGRTNGKDDSKELIHSLSFDGNDLFRDDLTVRFVGMK